MADATLASAPQISTVIPQQFIVEALGGADDASGFLARFPDGLYHKAPESHLVRLVYALLGPAGVGSLSDNYLKARLKLEEMGLELFDLDAFFGNPLAFGRILEEEYDVNATDVSEARAMITARDAAYRSRALDYIGGVRLGNSPAGMRLVAKAGLGHDAEIVENYRYLYDSHADRPVGFRYFGKTTSTEEMIVIPRQEISLSEIQEVRIVGGPTGGSFSLTYNGRQAVPPYLTLRFDAPALTSWLTITGATVANPSVITTSSAHGFTTGRIVEVKGVAGATAVNNTPDNKSWTITVLSPTTFSVPVNNTTAWTAGGVVMQNLGVQEALEAIPDIGPGNIRVHGGPGPDSVWVVTFQGELARQDTLPIGIVNKSLTGGLNPDILVTTILGGVDATQETVDLPSRALYHLQSALDRIKAVTTIPTVFSGSGTRQRQAPRSDFTSSEFTTVLRFVTGLQGVPWPAGDWIEANVENEAPRALGIEPQHYQGFHDVASVLSYFETALANPSYESDRASVLPFQSVHMGPFAPEQRALNPALLQAPADRYTADRALADYPEQPLMDTSGLVNGIYDPADTSLPGTRQILYKDEQFWSSIERNAGSEYLEIDLGSVQMVSFLAFETLRKPLVISLAFDTLDQAPRRHFTPAHRALGIDFPNIISPTLPGWTYLEFNFTDVRGEPIYTRFLRIEIARTLNPNAPYLYNPDTRIFTPWSVEVRNLRVGRNVSN